MWVSQYTPTGNVLSITLRDANNRDYTYSRRAGLQSALGVDAIRSHRFNIGSTVWQPGGNIFVNSPSVMVPSANQYSVLDAAGNVVSVSGAGMMAIDGANLTREVQGGGPGIASGTPTGPVNGNFTIAGTGWGHNVGMSQWGAFSQAHYHGRTAEQIIQFYFTGVTIIRAY
jgi:stage II sporulation protein D